MEHNIELRNLPNNRGAMAIKLVAYNTLLQLSSSNFGWWQLKKSNYDSQPLFNLCELNCNHMQHQW